MNILGVIFGLAPLFVAIRILLAFILGPRREEWEELKEKFEDLSEKVNKAS